jgi:ABC-type lipoprotein release transport system permease subunit
MIFIGMPVLLFVITMLASWAPAHHAAQVDPLTSLHDE